MTTNEWKKRMAQKHDQVPESNKPPNNASSMFTTAMEDAIDALDESDYAVMLMV